MSDTERSAARRLVLPILVLLLLLGQACEPPAYAGLVGSLHAAEDRHHSGGGHHPGEPTISCDAVGLTSSPGCPQAGAALEISGAPRADDSMPARLAARSFEGRVNVAVRLPLFLLHASLLI